MRIITLAPKTIRGRPTPKQRVRVRYVREADWAYYGANLVTNAQLVFTKHAWVIVHSETVDGYVRLRSKENDMPGPGECEAKGCERDAYIRIRHWDVGHCDWSLLVCAKHEEAARNALEKHALSCREHKGTRWCSRCDTVIDYGQTYRRDPDDRSAWAHENCLTQDGTDDTVEVDNISEKKGKAMKDPVTKKPVKTKPSEDELPEDIEELELPDKVEFEDDEDDEAEAESEEVEKPSKRSTKDTRSTKSEKPAKSGKGKAKDEKPAKAEKPAKKGTKSEPVADTKSKKIAEKAKQATSKGEAASRVQIEKEPDGDTAIVGLKRGKGGEIRIRLNSHVITQWIASEKNKAVLGILGRQRYWFVVKSEEEADALIASATKIAEKKDTRKQFGVALNKAVSNIERWRKEIRKF